MNYQYYARTPLANEDADILFSNIDGSSEVDGLTIGISALRALLHERTDDKIFYRSANIFPNNTDIAEFIKILKSEQGISHIDSDGVIVDDDCSITDLIICNNMQHFAANSLSDELVSAIEASLNLKRVPKINEYFKGKTKIEAFIDNESKNVLIIRGSSFGITSYIKTLSAIPAMVPWYFENKTLSKVEENVILALNSGSQVGFLKSISNIKNQQINEARVRRLLSDITVAYDTHKLTMKENELISSYQKIRDFNARISEVILCIKDLEASIAGLKNRIENTGDDGSEIQDYFIHNKPLTLISRLDTTIRFQIDTELEYYDVDEASALIKNTNGCIYYSLKRDRATASEIKDFQKLWEYVFSDDPKIKILTSTRFSLDMVTGNFYIDQDNNNPETQKYLPHPHIMRYNCLGNNESIIREAILNGNQIAAIDQMIAATRNINFGDTTVIEAMGYRLWDDKGLGNKYFVLPDESIVDIVDAIDWIHKYEAEEGKEIEE